MKKDIRVYNPETIILSSSEGFQRVGGGSSNCTNGFSGG